LKKLKKAQVEHDFSTCAVVRCRQPAIEVANPGQYPGLDNKLRAPLCEKHLAEAQKEPEQEAPTPTLIPSPTVKAELETEAKDASEVLAMIEEFEIDTQEDYDFANEALGDVKSSWKTLEAKKKSVTKPLNDVLKEVRGWFKPAQDHYKKAEGIWKTKLAEAHRKAQEAQDKALKEVQEAHAAGNADGVKTALVKSQTSEIQQADNISVIQGWDFEVTDESKVPRQYMVPDVKAIGGVVKSLGEKADIPGVRVFPTERVVRRGA